MTYTVIISKRIMAGPILDMAENLFNFGIKQGLTFMKVAGTRCLKLESSGNDRRENHGENGFLHGC